MRILSLIRNLDFVKPIGLMQILAIAKQHGCQTDLAILSKEDVFQKIEEYKPDMILYSATTGEHNYYSAINRQIKARHKNIFTIMGGPHATFFPDVLIEANLDAICIGEGEDSFAELLDMLDGGKDISGVQNIVAKGGKVNNLRPLINNLDRLPFPDRELFYGKNIEEQLPIMNFITSRGCPYSCTYCFNHILKKNYSNWGQIRSHSVDYIIREILDAKKRFNFRYIRFNDDNFLLRSKDWLEQFIERYPKEVGLPFYAHSRFELATREKVRMLKRAGCTTLQMSIESPNERIRNEILKRNMSNDVILNGAKTALDEGISVLSYSMLGLPSATIQDDIDAVDYNIRAGIPVAEFPIFNPFPGTELARLCADKGYFDGDDKKFSMYGDVNQSLLNCFTLNEKNVQQNINLLGPIAVKHPFLRNIIMNHLVYFPTNRLYERIAIINKMINYPRYVYRRNYSLRERFDMLIKGFKMESVRRKKEMQKG